MFKSALNFLLPPICPLCRQSISAESERIGLCPDCWTQIAFVSHPICDVTGIPLPFDEGQSSVSALALAEKPQYDKARYVGIYQGKLRTLVHQMKYGDRTDANGLFASWLANVGAELLHETDILVPVPLHWRRLVSRRFNQSAELTKVLTRVSGVPTRHFILKRKKATKTQVGMSRNQRQRNVQAAFEIPRRTRHQLNGKTVTLVDDVVTTGSTVDACSRALKKAGAKKVFVLAIARVYNPQPIASASSFVDIV